jgi:D-glycero-D-manno-heptose 1,7-bisphosphate phosphatase
VVTNQSGIARGLYTLDDYHAVAHRLDEELRRRGVELDATYFCPHHPEFSGPCECRKPNTGMYLQAARELGLDLSGSYFVGDRRKDVAPAATLGGTGILVRTGYGREEEIAIEVGTMVVDSLLDAAQLILSAG